MNLLTEKRRIYKENQDIVGQVVVCRLSHAARTTRHPVSCAPPFRSTTCGKASQSVQLPHMYTEPDFPTRSIQKQGYLEGGPVFPRVPWYFFFFSEGYLVPPDLRQVWVFRFVRQMRHQGFGSFAVFGWVPATRFSLRPYEAPNAPLAARFSVLRGPPHKKKHDCAV